MARRLWHNAKVIVRIAVLPVGMAAAVLAFIALITASNTATAQVAGQTTVMYKVLPETEKRVSVITEGANKGFLSYIGKTPATITASIVGISGVYTGAAITFSAQVSLRALTVTIRALASCDISGGCDAFGLGTASGGAAGRLSVFMTTGLSTISMYVASGAKLDDRVLIGGETDTNTGLFLLYHLATAARTVRMSILAAGGANIDAETTDGGSDNRFHGWTPLFWLMTTGGLTDGVPGAAALLSLGADIEHTDHRGRNALHIGASSGRAALISLVGGAGVPLEHVANDQTPIFTAAEIGGENAVSALLSLGANVNRRDRQGRTPLHIAALSDKSRAAAMLVVVNSVDINAPDNGGWTPLHFAVRRIRDQGTDAMRVLLTAGANPNARANDGRTPLDVALWDEFRGRGGDAAMLVSRGGACSIFCGGLVRVNQAAPIAVAVSITAEAVRNVRTTVGFLDVSGGFLDRAGSLPYHFYALAPHSDAVNITNKLEFLTVRNQDNFTRDFINTDDDMLFHPPRYTIAVSVSPGGGSRLITISIAVGDICEISAPGRSRGRQSGTNFRGCAPQRNVSFTVTAVAGEFNAAIIGNDRLHNVTAGRFTIIGTVTAAASSPEIVNFALDSPNFRGTIVRRDDRDTDGDVFYLIAAPASGDARHEVVVTLNDNSNLYTSPTTVSFTAQVASEDEVILIGGADNSNGAVYVSPANNLRDWTNRGAFSQFSRLIEHAAVNYNGTIVVIGGRRNNTAQGVYWSADRGRTWSRGYDMPYRGGQRWLSGAVVHRGYLYVVGGDDTGDGYPDYAYRASDIRSAANWRRVAPPPDMAGGGPDAPAFLLSFRGDLIATEARDTFNFDFSRTRHYLQTNGSWRFDGRNIGGNTSPPGYLGGVMLSVNGRVLFYGPRVSHRGEPPAAALHTHRYVYHWDGEHLGNNGWSLCANRSANGTGPWANALAFRNAVYLFGGGDRQIQRFAADGCPPSSSTNDSRQQIPNAAKNRSRAVYMSDADALNNIQLPTAPEDFRAVIPFIAIPRGVHYQNEFLFEIGVENRQPGSNYTFELLSQGNPFVNPNNGLGVRGNSVVLNRNIGGGRSGPVVVTARILESGNIFESSGRSTEQSFTLDIIERFNTTLNFHENIRPVAIERGEWLRLSATVFGGFAYRGYDYTLRVSAHNDLDARLYLPNNNRLFSIVTTPFNDNFRRTTYYREANLYVRVRNDNYPQNPVRMTLGVNSRSPGAIARGIGRFSLGITLSVINAMSVTVRSQRQVSLTVSVPVSDEGIFIVDGLDGYAPPDVGYAYSLTSASGKFTIGTNDAGEGVVSLTSPLVNADAGTYTLTVHIADRNTPPARQVILLTALVVALADFRAEVVRAADGVIRLHTPLGETGGTAGRRQYRRR